MWRNTGANRLAAADQLDQTPLATRAATGWRDLLGTGTVGILFELPALRASAAGQEVLLDLTGGVKPDLLSDIANGQGLSTHITYQPSTTFAAAGRPAGAAWPTYHPFPVQCVARTDRSTTPSASPRRTSTVP